MTTDSIIILNVDLKRKMTRITIGVNEDCLPRLIFKFFDDGIGYNISTANKAELYHKTASGEVIVTNCELTTFDGRNVISYQYDESFLSKQGFIQTMLVVYENDYVVSIQHFLVIVEGENNEANYLSEITRLRVQLQELISELKLLVQYNELGVPNGIAQLDVNEQIPLEQLPNEVLRILDVRDDIVWSDWSHGLRVNRDGVLQYMDDNNEWKDVIL